MEFLVDFAECSYFFSKSAHTLSFWTEHFCYKWRPNQWHSFSCARCWSPEWPAAGRWRPVPSHIGWRFLGFGPRRQTQNFVLRWPTLPHQVTEPGTPNSLHLNTKINQKTDKNSIKKTTYLFLYYYFVCFSCYRISSWIMCTVYLYSSLLAWQCDREPAVGKIPALHHPPV